jgi:hypothetical protein
MYCTRRRRRRIRIVVVVLVAVRHLYTVCWSIRPRADGDQLRRIGTSLSSYVVVVGVISRGRGREGRE